MGIFDEFVNLVECDNESVVVANDGLYVKGTYYDWPRPNCQNHNVRQVRGKIFVDGYILRPDGWHRTLESIIENWTKF